MSAEEQLYGNIISWLDLSQEYANHSRESAEKLESINKYCNAGQLVGNTASVLGGLMMVGAGIATLCSAGAATPLLVVAGASRTAGSAITYASKGIEWFLERDILQDAKKISEKHKELGEKIQKCMQEMMQENMGGSGPPVGGDYVVECILRTIARRLELPWMKVVSWMKSAEFGPSMFLIDTLKGHLRRLDGMLAYHYGSDFARGAAEIVQELGQLGALQIGKGVFTVVMTLPDTIDNYKRAIENNNVTGPSKELRDTADELEETTTNFRKTLNDIKRRMEEQRRMEQRRMEQQRMEQQRMQQRRMEEQRMRELRYRWWWCFLVVLLPLALSLLFYWWFLC